MVDVENVWLYLRKSRSNHIKLIRDFKEAIYLCSKDPTEKEIRSLWNKESGLVTLSKFTEIVNNLPDISENELLSAFKIFDVNGDNSLSLDELGVMLTKLGDRMSTTEVKRIFEQLDVNKDGKLDYKEFCGLYTSTNKQMQHVIAQVVNKKSEPMKSDTKLKEQMAQNMKKLKEVEKEINKAENRDSEKKAQPVTGPEKRTSKSLTDLEPRAGQLRKSKIDEDIKPKKTIEKTKPTKKAVEEAETKVLSKEELNKTEEEKKAEAKISEFTSFEIEGDTSEEDTSEEDSEEDSDMTDTDDETLEKTDPDFKTWKNNNMRGCIYAGERGDWTTHQYNLSLPMTSNVCIMISTLAQTKGPKNQTDLSVYILEKSGKKQRFLTNKLVDGRSCFSGVLDAGEYKLMPHSSSCTFVNSEVLPPTPVSVNNGNTLSPVAIKVFTDIFHCLDLNGDMLLSRQEFELFHIISSGEPLSDPMWNVLGENFEMEKDQITLTGFLKLHEMALEDTEGGEEEIRDTLSSMGYNSALQLVKACPYHIDVYTETEAKMSLASLLALTSNPLLERALVGLTQKFGREESVGEVSLLHVYTLPWRCSAAVTNKTATPLRIEVNTVGSRNCIENPPYQKHILTVPANRTIMCHHFTPEYRDKKFVPLITIRALPPKESGKPKADSTKYTEVLKPKPDSKHKPTESKPEITKTELVTEPEKPKILEPKPEAEKSTIDLPKYEPNKVIEKTEKKLKPSSSKIKSKGLLSRSSKSSKTPKGKSKSSTDL